MTGAPRAGHIEIRRPLPRLLGSIAALRLASPRHIGQSAADAGPASRSRATMPSAGGQRGDIGVLFGCAIVAGVEGRRAPRKTEPAGRFAKRCAMTHLDTIRYIGLA